jgi:hypothetical protein
MGRSASCSGRFTPGERAHTHSIKGRVGVTAGLYVVKKRRMWATDGTKRPPYGIVIILNKLPSAPKRTSRKQADTSTHIDVPKQQA